MSEDQILGLARDFLAIKKAIRALIEQASLTESGTARPHQGSGRFLSRDTFSVIELEREFVKPS